MKRTVVSIFLLIVLGILLYIVWIKFGGVQPKQTVAVSSGAIVDLLSHTSSGNTTETTGTEITLDSGSFVGADYEGGGEYKPFFAQSAKQALGDGKDVILYFNASRDPTDEALDHNIQEREDRIPKNAIIFKIDYDTSKDLRKSFNVTEQNTLIFLDKQGVEKTRRAIGITALSQIVNVLQDK